MKTIVVVSSFLLMACSGPRYISRDEANAPPVTRVAQPPAPAPTPVVPTAPSVPLDEAATQAWLQQQIEQQRLRQPEPEPIYRYVEQVVERPAYTHDPSAQGVGWDENGQPVYAAHDPHHDHHDIDFPIHTAVGAGIGAIIGHQSGHRDEGALIGGALGLLTDLGRWFH